jgi:hypothetical protein
MEEVRMILFGYSFAPWLVKTVLTGVAFVALFAGWLITHDAKVVQKERASVQAKGEKIRAKAIEARRAADAPGSAERVRSKYCRDC